MLALSSDRAYVRDDHYDAVKQSVENAKPDHYFFQYYHYSDETNDYNKYVLLNDEESAAVNKALKASEKEKIKYSELSDGAYDMQTIRLSVCDKDMLLTDPYTTYFVFKDGERYFFWDGMDYNEKCIYQFKDDDEQIVKNIFRQYPDAPDNDNILWRIENKFSGNEDIIDDEIVYQNKDDVIGV